MSAPVEEERSPRRAYERIARHYLERNRTRRGLDEDLEAFVSGLAPGARVLDVGCGPGLDSTHLSRLGLEPILLDRALSMLLCARLEVPGQRVRADFRDLPLPDASLDGIWASASLVHLPKDELVAVLVELRRVLRIEAPLYLSVKRGRGEAWEADTYGLDAPRFFVYWSAEALDDSLRTAGFDPIWGTERDGNRSRWLCRVARCGRADTDAGG